MKGSVLYYLFPLLIEIIVKIEAQVTVVTVASNVNHLGYKKFLLSAKAYGIPVKNLNENGRWNYTSMKIHLLREFLTKLESKNQSDHIILFVDSYDLLFLSGLNEIIGRFKSFSTTKVLFSAELNCSPTPRLAKRYSRADRATVYPYLNSGGIIGYLPYLRRILNYKIDVDGNDDQLFYSFIYLDNSLRKTFRMTLDHNATVFMNLAGAGKDITIVNTTRGYRVENIRTKDQPPIIHGQGSSQRSTLKQLYKTYFKTQFENFIHPRIVSTKNNFHYRKVG